ncbi:hypothetical protein ASPWEDRAFT_57684 [Aspergillus wentii DTO 134E9]|uniref:CSN8/PSMD8/EIF3K domain-containing protein n=1 Tax=Aspergillus wentii DTO 134E9 TaxID=1073089 RepID=A0A1L9RW64_ASPWE|nr:uncharacterized protein ASPWEDRAFT_57684 [Aspergillus wentii DTO 134E9]KAI9929113.1 hypothetical protein MW887_001517 [Aspergillus wentii]OJJ39191.1 hypothetical protein ASPWEDRAFT_57684 [Aspergillus wentii DTO 134E9]
MAGSMHARKPSGSRLKPVADTLEAVGFVSKGDRKLLDQKTQNEYFEKIVNRFLEFCATHHDDLDAALASLPTSSSGDPTKNPPASFPQSKSKPGVSRGPSASTELSTILLSLRKLREAVLATASTTPVSFSQQVHVFSIRTSILAQHPPSYFPSLRYLLERLHKPSHPLSDKELKETTSYLILDYACRQCDMVAAFELRAHARSRYAFESQTIDRVLAALMQDNWIVFWKIRNEVDSKMRALMNWAVDRMRRHALKAVGSAYLNVDVRWIVEGCTGERQNWTWDKLVEKEKLGWLKEGDKIIIKRPRLRPEKKLVPIKEGS